MEGAALRQRGQSLNMSTSAPPSQKKNKKEEGLGKPMDLETRLMVAIQTPTLFGILPLAMKAVAQVCSGDFLVVYFGILYWCLNQPACVRYIVSLCESSNSRKQPFPCVWVRSTRANRQT